MKKYRVETQVSLDRKIDVREVLVENDKFVLEKEWVRITVAIQDKYRTYIIPLTQVKLIEIINE